MSLRWQCPGGMPAALASHCYAACSLQEFQDRMAGEECGDLCKKQPISNLLVISHVAWQEGCPVRLHPQKNALKAALFHCFVGS